MAEVVTSASRNYFILVLILSILILIALIYSAARWDTIRKGSCSAITRNEADALFWVNVIAAIIAGVVLIAALWKVFTTTTSYSRKKSQLVAARQAFANPEYVVVPRTVSVDPRIAAATAAGSSGFSSF